MKAVRLAGVLGAFLFGLASSLDAAAQNKLISKRFKWKVAQTEHFNVHYYQGAEKILPFTADVLENAHASVTKSLGITIPHRSDFFLFLNHNEFEENNIVQVGEGTGGVTEAFKDRFLVFNNGARTWLEHVARHEFAHVAQFQVLYAGFWKSVRLLKSVLYPLWFMEGMAEYYSGEIDDVERDMVIRDAVAAKQVIPLAMLHGFNHVKPHQVTLSYKTGAAALEYIAREYGEDKIGLLLKDLSEKFDIGSSLEEVLGVSFADFGKRFQEDLEERYAADIARMKSPESYGAALTHPDGLYPVYQSNPVYFPDGKAVLYLSDKDGFTELYRYDFEYKRPSSLDIQKKFPDKVENLHQAGSGLSISKDGRWVLFAGEWHQRDYLYLYDLKRDRLKRVWTGLDNVYSPQFSPEADRIAFIGMKDGVTDIYLADGSGKNVRALTNTLEDESDVRFFSDGQKLLYSRESLTKIKQYERNLWTLSLDDLKEKPLTHLEGNEFQPAISASGTEILFIGDGTGVRNLYRLSVPDGRSYPLTDVVGGNFFPAFSPDESKVIFVSHFEGEQHLYEADKEKLFEAAQPLVGARKGADPLKLAVETAETPVRVVEGKPYKFKASTDFFFPILYYSSLDGLFASAYWQASEMLGNHQLQAAVSYASEINFLNYQVFYSYLRFRPQFFVGFLGDTQDSVFLTTRETRREDAQLAGVSYPLGRFDQVQAQFMTTDRRIQFEDDDFVTQRYAGRENVASFSYIRDLSQGRFLETTQGYRVIANYEEADAAIGSTLDYRNAFLTLHQFLPVHRESSVALRLFGGGGFGRDRQFFRTGGSDLLRGYGRFDTGNAAHHFLINNIEFRFPIFFNANYHVWFFFPDFLFKNIYGAIFMDSGVLWNDRDDLLRQGFGDVKNSVGVGVRFQTFVLQTFPVILRLDFARRTSDGEQTWYLGLGPTF